jgi:hypothetical protein
MSLWISAGRPRSTIYVHLLIVIKIVVIETFSRLAGKQLQKPNSQLHLAVATRIHLMAYLEGDKS